MTIENPIPFQIINWDNIPATEHKGETGFANWQPAELTGLRIRIVIYSQGYMANHWYRTLPVRFIINELENGEAFMSATGMSYIASDEILSERFNVYVNSLLP